MDKRYFLGPRAARFIHDQMNASGAGGAQTNGVVVSEVYRFPDPWTLRWSSSVTVSGSGDSAVNGGWIIWIPQGSLIGSLSPQVSSASFARALTREDDDMPEGWFLLSLSLCTQLNQSGTNHLYLDVDSVGIVFRTTYGLVHVADSIVNSTTGAKNVNQILRSSVSLEPKPFDIYRSGSGNSATFTIARPYFNVGAKTYQASVSVSGLSSNLPCIVALRIGMTGSTPAASIVTAASIVSLQSEQQNINYATIPLYQLDANGNIICDFRSGAIAVAGEF